MDLIQAIQAGDIETVRRQLYEGVSANSRNERWEEVWNGWEIGIALW